MRTELTPPRTIIFPVDLSEHSRGAAALVSSVAQRFDSRVIVLSAVEPVDHPFEMFSEGFETRSRTEVARGKVAAFIKEMLPELRSEIYVEEGEPADVIVGAAEKLDADLICMPTRGHGPFRRFLLGSTTGKVLNDAPVPVLTGAHLNLPNTTRILGIRRVVCAFSPDERGEVALRAALLVSQAFDAGLTVVHALESHTREQVEAAIRALAGDRAEIVIDSGDPARVVSKNAEGADLLVIGRTSPGPLGRLRTQSYGIVRESPCPVLSV